MAHTAVAESPDALESPARQVTDHTLPDRVFQKLWELRRACAPNLANFFPNNTVDEIVAALDQLVEAGKAVVVEQAEDDDRQYEPPYQTVYEPV